MTDIELKDLIENEDFISGKGKEIKTHMLEAYKEEIKAKIKLKKNKASYGQKKKQNKPNDKKAGNNV